MITYRLTQNNGPFLLKMFHPHGYIASIASKHVFMELGVMSQACNPSTQEAGTRTCCRSEASLDCTDFQISLVLGKTDRAYALVVVLKGLR